MEKFIKSQPVLSISFILAFISCFFVTPDAVYVSYLDFRTLSLLFCLMAVVHGWQKSSVFDFISGNLLKMVKNTRSLIQILVFMCFFLSMFITNDVALIAFVPFAILVETNAGCSKKYLIITVVLQTIAANLGSMLLPVGNPQNLYLYGLSGLGMLQFIQILLPYWFLSVVLLFIATLFIPKDNLAVDIKPIALGKGYLFYTLLFIICMATVAGLIPYYLVLGIVLIATLFYDKTTFKGIDYFLLFTFVCFFVFIGNIKRIDAISVLLSELIAGREFITGVLLSQIISNVPAAILLSGFTDKYQILVAASDIGGLGTPIASLASIISMTAYNKAAGSNPKKYLGTFLLLNFIFLIIISSAYMLLH